MTGWLYRPISFFFAILIHLFLIIEPYAPCYRADHNVMVIDIAVGRPVRVYVFSPKRFLGNRDCEKDQPSLKVWEVLVRRHTNKLASEAAAARLSLRAPIGIGSSLSAHTVCAL